MESSLAIHLHMPCTDTVSSCSLIHQVLTWSDNSDYFTSYLHAKNIPGHTIRWGHTPLILWICTSNLIKYNYTS